MHLSSSSNIMNHIQNQSAVIVGLGYLGLPLAQALYERGYGLTAFKRHFTSDDAVLPFWVHVFDFNDESLWRVADWQNDLPMQADWYVLLPPTPFADYPRVIARWLAVAHAHRAAHFVFASSISVYGDAVRDCDENSGVAPESTSACAIVEAEKVLLNSELNNIAIVRLGGLYCAARHPLTAILRKGYLKHPYAPANMLHRDRAVAALMQAAQTDGRRIVNAVEVPHLRRCDFYTQQARQLGLPVPDFDVHDTTSGKRVFSIYETRV